MTDNKRKDDPIELITELWGAYLAVRTPAELRQARTAYAALAPADRELMIAQLAYANLAELRLTRRMLGRVAATATTIEGHVADSADASTAIADLMHQVEPEEASPPAPPKPANKKTNKKAENTEVNPTPAPPQSEPARRGQRKGRGSTAATPADPPPAAEPSAE